MVKLNNGGNIDDMNKILSTITMTTILLFISACTANPSQLTDKTPEIVDVEIIMPEKISLNQETTLKVQVMQGTEMVDDADDVQFELWKVNSKEDGELIEAEDEKDGTYSIKKTFKEDGIYYVQTHVTARGLHVMPKKLFIVGDVSEEELNSLTQEQKNQEQSHGHHH